MEVVVFRFIFYTCLAVIACAIAQLLWMFFTDAETDNLERFTIISLNIVSIIIGFTNIGMTFDTFRILL